MNQASKTRLYEIHPKLAFKVTQLENLLGKSLEVVQGLRSWAQQAAIWAQGRTMPGAIVTRCPPGHSWHQFGLAVDICPDELLGSPDWNPEHPDWQQIETLAESIGLVSGGGFSSHDHPHLQLTGRFPVNPNNEARQLFKDGGMQAVWNEGGL